MSPLKQATLDQAQQFAYSILGSKPQHEGSVSCRPSVHHHHYGHNWIWLDRPHYMSDYCRPSLKMPQQKQKENENLALQISIVAILTAAYFLGIDWAQTHKAERQLKNLNGQREMLKQSEGEVDEKTHQVLEIQADMLQVLKAEGDTGMALKAAIITSAAAAALGTFFSPLVMTAGVAGLGVSSAAGLFNWGYRDNSTYVKERALELLETVDAARNVPTEKIKQSVSA